MEKYSTTKEEETDVNYLTPTIPTELTVSINGNNINQQQIAKALKIVFKENSAVFNIVSSSLHPGILQINFFDVDLTEKFQNRLQRYVSQLQFIKAFSVYPTLRLSAVEPSFDIFGSFSKLLTKMANLKYVYLKDCFLATNMVSLFIKGVSSSETLSTIFITVCTVEKTSDFIRVRELPLKQMIRVSIDIVDVNVNEALVFSFAQTVRQANLELNRIKRAKPFIFDFEVIYPYNLGGYKFHDSLAARAFKSEMIKANRVLLSRDTYLFINKNKNESEEPYSFSFLSTTGLTLLRKYQLFGNEEIKL